MYFIIERNRKESNIEKPQGYTDMYVLPKSPPASGYLKIDGHTVENEIQQSWVISSWKRPEVWIGFAKKDETLEINKL